MKKLHTKIHWEIARGSNEQAITYCKKDGTYVEFGKKPKDKGKGGGAVEKERWENARDLAKLGKIDDVPADIFIRHYSTLRRIRKDYMASREETKELCGLWVWGEPGTGKSRGIRDTYGKDLYSKMCNKWWDGYQEEKYVLLDDFDIRHKVLGHHLKIWADRYPFIAENKGGAANIRPEVIAVTSNYSPDSIWFDEPETLGAIKRRFTIYEMK